MGRGIFILFFLEVKVVLIRFGKIFVCEMFVIWGILRLLVEFRVFFWWLKMVVMCYDL